MKQNRIILLITEIRSSSEAASEETKCGFLPELKPQLGGGDGKLASRGQVVETRNLRSHLLLDSQPNLPENQQRLPEDRVPLRGFRGVAPGAAKVNGDRFVSGVWRSVF